MPVERVLQLIKDEKNILVHPSMWDDPFENFFLNSKFESNGKILNLGGLKDNLFGQCWTLGAEETDAMWRIYSPNKDGVRVKSTLSKVISPLKSQNISDFETKVFIGKVEYVVESELVNQLQNAQIDSATFIFRIEQMIINSLLIKRKAFEHEKEIRVIYRGESNLNSQIHGYTINPQDFIQELLFDPRMDQNAYNTFAEEINKLLPKCPISKSTLYKSPDFTIHL